MLYNKKNYILMIISVLIIVVGFILMSGGGSPDGVTYNPEMFSWRRIVLAPFVCVVGFALMVYAIMAKPSGEEMDCKEPSDNK
ncbi:DUF3098 domain-containing protein [Falsiporphyromonas endometrii]|uniref:DUF3098 domain-containing protein n=1 Tax=Falsiporphyromonas endometrii TaxID=1387297 RepID=A0ABV9K966_9PORP